MTIRSGEQFILPESETIRDDLYAAGGISSLDGNVEGDAFLVGGNVVVTGRVSNDLFAAGGMVDIEGEVGDDLRVGGGNIIVRNNIKGDVLIGGGTVHIRKDSVIEGDLAVGGGQVTIDGTIKGKVLLGGGAITVNGTLDGDVDIVAEDSLTFGPAAKVAKKVNYRGNREATVSTGAALAQGIQFMRLERPARQAAGYGALVFGWIFKTIMLLIVALIAVSVFKRFSQAVVNATLLSPGLSLLYGFIFAVVTPIAIIALLITLIGAYLAGVLGLVYALLLVLAKVYAGIFAGTWALSLLDKNKPAVVDWKAALLGVLGLSLIGLIPFIGWVFVWVATLMALGGLYGLGFKQLKAAR